MRALLGQRATPQLIAYYNHIYGFDSRSTCSTSSGSTSCSRATSAFRQVERLVTTLIGQDLPKTIILVLLGTIVSLLFGIPLGVYQAVHATAPPTTC